jgi:hypothetical protein
MNRRPEDKSHLKQNRVKNFRKLEIRKNFIFKSFDIKKPKQANLINKHNFNKTLKKNSKNSILSIENTIMDENEENFRKPLLH